MKTDMIAVAENVDINKYDDIVYHLFTSMKEFMTDLNLIFAMIYHILYELVIGFLVFLEGIFQILVSLLNLVMIVYYLSKVVKLLDKIFTNALMVVCFSFLLVRIIVIHNFNYFCKRVNKYI